MENFEKQKQYFKAITKDREENAKILDKPSMRGIKSAVSDKYSDQAHFIYELLQNADDAKAKKVRFILSIEGLTFIHDGTEFFTASNPLTEDEDGRLKQLGHINAITSIGQSAKDKKATIGKFGVGFKSIEHYSKTPEIYDKNFWFKIERLVVPKELTEDHKERKINETLFYFPFDVEDKSKDECFNDIIHKLKSLIQPILFLNNLEDITWETKTKLSGNVNISESDYNSELIAENNNGQYSKVVKDEFFQNGITSQLFELFEKKDNKTIKKDLWLFTKEIQKEDVKHKYSVGFFIDKNNKLDTSINYHAFCFFPTKETTNLKFIIHAPFLLTESRAGIKAGEQWNKELVQKLSILAADSLLILKELFKFVSDLNDIFHNDTRY